MLEEQPNMQNWIFVRRKSSVQQENEKKGKKTPQMRNDWLHINYTWKTRIEHKPATQ